MDHLAHKVCPRCQARVLDAHRYCPNCATDLDQVDMVAGDLFVGMKVAERYVIRDCLGIGAMGRVYRAEQLALGKSVAIKLLHAHLIHDPESHARFANEAHNAASLNHPNVVSVVDYGRTSDGISYLVMELIDGLSLESIIAEEFPLARARVLDLTLQILAALTEAHGLSILHRDLKPENILIQTLRTHGELLKVLDFGIAKLMDTGHQAKQDRLTNQGTICGTPEYMSPEQARGAKLDVRSDLYSVGVILYQMLTGRVPFTADSPVEVLHKHIHDPPPQPSEIVGQDLGLLEAVCLRALAKDPRARFASATEFREVLISTSRDLAIASAHCASCGAHMNADAKYCPTCGAARSFDALTEAANHPTLKLGFGAEELRGRTAEMVLGAFPLPLSGRSVLLERIKQRLGTPPTELVGQILLGESGSGRTRLLDEIADVARTSGWYVLSIGCDPEGAAPPLWPIRRLLADVLGLEIEALTTQDLGRASNLIGLSFEALPGLAELFSLHGPATGAEYAVRRRECFAAAIQAMVSAGHSAPLLLQFDDVDRYDTASRQVVQQLLKSDCQRPVLVLVSTSETDVSWLNAEANRLHPLSARDVQAIAEPIVAEINPDSKLPQRLARAAPISPLRLELELWLQALHLPSEVDKSDHALIARRLEVLTPEALRTLQAAAILGEQPQENDLEELLNTEANPPSPADLAPSLDELHELGLLVCAQTGARRFPNRLVRRVAYEDCEAARRQRLHLVTSQLGRVARSPSLHAMHAMRGKSPELIDSLERAAAEAVRLFDDRKALGLLRAALQCVDATPGPRRAAANARLRRQLAHLVAATHVQHDRVGAARALFGHTPDVRTEATLERSLGRALQRSEQHAEAVTAYQRALRLLIAEGEPADILEVYAELGRSFAKAGDPSRGIRELMEGLDMCTFGEGPRAHVDLSLWRYILRLTQLLRDTKQLRKARTWCEHALYQAERQDDDLGRLRCHTEMAWVLRDLKQATLAETHLARALEHARYFGDRMTTAEILLERARLRASHGRLADARRCFGEALRLARVVEWNEGISHAKRAISSLQDKHVGA